MSRYILIGLISTICLSGKGTQASKEWDLLIFTQHWPITVCLEYEESVDTIHNHYCTFPPRKDQWTIHGVWPTKLHTEGPGFCNTSIKFESEILDPIKPELLNIWPNIEGDKGESSLWKHEWLKHGTCAVTLETLNTEFKYFNAGLDFYQKYNMTNILSENGIVPGDTATVQVEDIHQAVLKTVGKNPQIRCIVEKETQEHYLFEVRLCFDKQFTITDCDGTKGKVSSSLFDGDILTNCPLSQPLHYPSQVKTVQINLETIEAENPIKVHMWSDNPIKWYHDYEFLQTILHRLMFLQWLTI